MKRLVAFAAIAMFTAAPLAAQAQDVSGSVSGAVSGAAGSLGLGTSADVEADVDIRKKNDVDKGITASIKTDADAKSEIRRRNAQANADTELSAESN
jgi:Ni/Co efflux regulator RcnB